MKYQPQCCYRFLFFRAMPAPQNGYNDSLHSDSYLSIIASSHALHAYTLKCISNGGGNLAFLENQHSNINTSGSRGRQSQMW